MRNGLYRVAGIFLMAVMTVGVVNQYSRYANAGECYDNVSSEESYQGNPQIVVYGPDDTHLDAITEAQKTEPEILDELKGNSIPTTYWNLYNGPYQFFFVSLSGSTYLNRLFTTDTKNCIAMSMGSLNSGGHNITVTLYSGLNRTYVMSWTGDPQSISGLGFTNLDPNQLYYFKFEVSSGTLTGSGYVLYD